MTRSNEIRGGLALITCLAAAITFVVLVPGSGAGAREDSVPCAASSPAPGKALNKGAANGGGQAAAKGGAGQGNAGANANQGKPNQPDPGAANDNSGATTCGAQVLAQGGGAPTTAAAAPRVAKQAQAPKLAPPALGTVDGGGGRNSASPPGRETPSGPTLPATPPSTGVGPTGLAPTGSPTVSGEPTSPTTGTATGTSPGPAPVSGGQTSEPGQGSSSAGTAGNTLPAAPPLASVPASDTMPTRIPPGPSTSSPAEPSRSGSRSLQPHPPTSSTNTGSRLELAPKSATGAGNSLILAALLLAFTVAVSAVVLVAGRRGGRHHRTR